MKELFKRQQFHPGLLGLFINPFYLARRELKKHIASLAPRLHGALLDIGCGSKPYAELFPHAAQYTGMEFASPKRKVEGTADAYYNGTRFPFPDRAFDSALATEVLEHVFNPDEFLEETRRILKPEGVLLVTCPFIWNEHEQPYDYGRYSSFGLRHLLEKHGFEIVESRKTVPHLGALCQLINCYIYEKLPFKNYRVRLLCYILLCFPFNLLGVILSVLLPKSDDLYLGNVMLARKL